MVLRFGGVIETWRGLSMQTQLRALRMFFGVETLHPKVSLLAEMGDLPVRWQAKLRCVLFWAKILSSRAHDGRLIRQVDTDQGC